jgi:hypothetical protein
MDCTLSFSARSKNKDADLWKLRATEINLVAAQKFVRAHYTVFSKFVPCRLCDKITCYWQVQIYLRTPIAGNKIYFASPPHWLNATETLPCDSFFSAVTCEFYARFCSRRDAILLHICPSVCPALSVGLSLEWFPCNFFIGNLNENIST